MGDFSERRVDILEYLKDKPAQTVRQIQAGCKIPMATLYRDLKRLEEAGLIRNQHGRVSLADDAQPASVAGKACVYCGAPVTSRMAFSIRLEDGGQVFACCAHCGLMYLEANTTAQSAMAADFLYGKMINARQAIFLLESEVRPCCEPSVLCFASPGQAERFQKGFGGRLLEYEPARRAVAQMMKLQKQ